MTADSGREAQSERSTIARIWRWNTLFLAIQGFPALVYYAVNGDTFNAALSGAFFAGIPALLILLLSEYGQIGPGAPRMNLPAVVSCTSVWANSIAIFAFMGEIPLTGAPLLIILVMPLGAVSMAWMAVWQARKEGASERPYKLFLTALPVGIGSLIGGLLLIARHSGSGHA